MDADKQQHIANVHPYLQAAVALELHPVTETFMFRLGQEIKHVKTGAIYIVSGLPNQFVIEHTREPAYAYLMPDGRTCVRAQQFVEDGRFETAPAGASLEWWQSGTNFQDWLEKNNSEPDFAPTPESKKVKSAIDFDRFAAYGAVANPNDLHNGHAWSFFYLGRPVTHENDNCYLILEGKNTLRFERGDMLLQLDDTLVVSRVNV